MIIRLNGEHRAVASKTLDALIDELGLAPDTVATAVNQDFVPRPERAQAAIVEGDAVEILSPMKGG